MLDRFWLLRKFFYGVIVLATFFIARSVVPENPWRLFLLFSALEVALISFFYARLKHPGPRAVLTAGLLTTMGYLPLVQWLPGNLFLFVSAVLATVAGVWFLGGSGARHPSHGLKAWVSFLWVLAFFLLWNYFFLLIKLQIDESSPKPIGQAVATPTNWETHTYWQWEFLFRSDYLPYYATPVKPSLVLLPPKDSPKKQEDASRDVLWTGLYREPSALLLRRIITYMPGVLKFSWYGFQTDAKPRVMEVPLDEHSSRSVTVLEYKIFFARGVRVYLFLLSPEKEATRVSAIYSANPDRVDYLASRLLGEMKRSPRQKH